MAIPALSVGSYNRLKSQIAQYRATTGRDPSTQVLQALMETDVSQAQQRALQDEELSVRKDAQTFQQTYQTSQAETQKEQFGLSLENQKKQFDKSFEFNSTNAADQLAIQREGLSAQADAAKTSGMIQLGQTAAMGAYLLKDTAIGTAATGALTATGKAISGALGFSGGASLGTSTVGGATLTTGLGEYGALEGAGMSGFGATATADGAAAGAGAAGSFSVAGPAAIASYAGGEVGERVLGDAVGKKTGGDIGAIGAATATGFAIGGPPGAVVGAVVGTVSRVINRIFGGSILCTELYRQGLVTKQLVIMSTLYKKNYLEPEIYKGYLIVFTPIVNKMKSSSLVTKLMTPFGKCLFTELASKVSKKYKSTFTGKLVFAGTYALCKTVGRINSWIS